MSADLSVTPPDNVRTRAEHEVGILYSRLKGSIVDGQVSAGSRLPTERALSAQHRVARNTVRKTMTRLMDEGLIVRTVGRGTFVAEQVAPAEDEASFNLPELFEARLLFEPALAELVVERATETDFAAFDAALADMQSAHTWIDYKEAKYALHMAIARASGNRFIQYIFEKIIETRRAAQWDRADGQSGPLALVRETACRDNAAIVAALRAREGARARELVHNYLMRVLFSVSGA
jgi:DNA-binding FadR family transcriptional regulator